MRRGARDQVTRVRQVVGRCSMIGCISFRETLVCFSFSNWYTNVTRVTRSSLHPTPCLSCLRLSLSHNPSPFFSLSPFLIAASLLLSPLYPSPHQSPYLISSHLISSHPYLNPPIAPPLLPDHQARVRGGRGPPLPLLPLHRRVPR